MWKSCVHPDLKHPGFPVYAKNFKIMDDGMVCVKDPETGRWFEAFLQCVRYKCCRHIIWIEKDFVNIFKKTFELDLTSHEPPV